MPSSNRKMSYYADRKQQFQDKIFMFKLINCVSAKINKKINHGKSRMNFFRWVLEKL